MGIVTGVGRRFMEEMPIGTHILFDGSPTDTIMIALYGPSAVLSPSTGSYTTSGEVSGGGYSAGGIAIPLTVVGASGSARADGNQFSYPYINPTDDTTIPITGVGVRGAMVYNASKSNRNIFTLDFGTTLVPSTGILIEWGLSNVIEFSDALIPLVGNQR